MRVKLLTVLIGLATVAAALGQTERPTLPPDEEIRRVIIDRIDVDHWSVGMVVGVVSPEGRRIVSYGTARRGDVPSVNGDTVFEVASTTKVFTALLLAEMALRREVALDDPIEKFLPTGVTAPRRDGKSITLRDLATHTSGLPRQPSNWMPRDRANPYEDYSVAQLYTFLSSVTLASDPGTTYNYSNVGAGLLGHLLALRKKTDFKSLVTDQVLKPVGMHDSAFALSPQTVRRAATGHNFLLQPVSDWDVAEALAGAGGLRSTANDLLTFLSAVLNSAAPTIRNAIDLMLAVPRQTSVPDLMVGLGWHLRLFEGRTLIYHDGASGGYRSFIGFDRETRTGVVILSNTSSEADLNDFGMHLLDRRAVLLTFRPTAPGDPAVLDRYTGVYQLSSGIEMAVVRYGWLLYAQPTARPAFVLSADGEHEFSIRDVDLTRPPMYTPAAALPTRLTFEVDSTGPANALTLQEGSRITRGTRVR